MPPPPPPPLLRAATVLGGRFVVDRKIGEGTFSEIYRVADVTNGELVAVKVGKLDGVLRWEAAILAKLQPCEHVCRHVHTGAHEGRSYVAMELLGDSLSALRRRQPGGRLSWSTTLRLAVQLLEALRGMHELGFVHRDVKPSNFAMGCGEAAGRCYIIDFGLCKSFRSAQGAVQPQRDGVPFRGSSAYASVYAHFGKDLGRRDDLWSLYYVLVELLVGDLPWRNMANKEKVGALKEYYNEHPQKLMPSTKLPEELLAFVEHLRMLAFEDEPDYQHLHMLLVKAQQRLGCKASDPYDWEMAVEEGNALHDRQKQGLRASATDNDMRMLLDGAESSLLPLSTTASREHPADAHEQQRAPPSAAPAPVTPAETSPGFVGDGSRSERLQTPSPHQDRKIQHFGGAELRSSWRWQEPSSHSPVGQRSEFRWSNSFERSPDGRRGELRPSGRIAARGRMPLERGSVHSPRFDARDGHFGRPLGSPRRAQIQRSRNSGSPTWKGGGHSNHEEQPLLARSVSRDWRDLPGGSRVNSPTRQRGTKRQVCVEAVFAGGCCWNGCPDLHPARSPPTRATSLCRELLLRTCPYASAACPRYHWTAKEEEEYLLSGLLPRDALRDASWSNRDRERQNLSEGRDGGGRTKHEHSRSRPQLQESIAGGHLVLVDKDKKPNQQVRHSSPATTRGAVANPSSGNKQSISNLHMPQDMIEACSEQFPGGLVTSSQEGGPTLTKQLGVPVPADNVTLDQGDSTLGQIASNAMLNAGCVAPVVKNAGCDTSVVELEAESLAGQDKLQAVTATGRRAQCVLGDHAADAVKSACACHEAGPRALYPEGDVMEVGRRVGTPASKSPDDHDAESIVSAEQNVVGAEKDVAGVESQRRDKAGVIFSGGEQRDKAGGLSEKGVHPLAGPLDVVSHKRERSHRARRRLGLPMRQDEDAASQASMGHSAASLGDPQPPRQSGSQRAPDSDSETFSSLFVEEECDGADGGEVDGPAAPAPAAETFIQTPCTTPAGQAAAPPAAKKRGRLPKRRGCQTSTALELLPKASSTGPGHQHLEVQEGDLVERSGARQRGGRGGRGGRGARGGRGGRGGRGSRGARGGSRGRGRGRGAKGRGSAGRSPAAMQVPECHELVTKDLGKASTSADCSPLESAKDAGEHGQGDFWWELAGSIKSRELKKLGDVFVVGKRRR
eukprot:SM000426S15719  [mRNA]  locus=s426:16335:22593:- [translate_table: standard]